MEGFVDGGHFSYKVIMMGDGKRKTLEAPDRQVPVIVFKNGYTNPRSLRFMRVSRAVGAYHKGGIVLVGVTGIGPRCSGVPKRDNVIGRDGVIKPIYFRRDIWVYFNGVRDW